jgi:hypothetical protein
MNKIFICLLWLSSAFQINLSAQRQYVVEYDKKLDSFSYFEETRKNGKVSLKSFKRIEPQKGDEVKVLVKNVNEFIYKTSVEFRAGEVVNESEPSSNSLIEALSEFDLPGFSGISVLANAISRAEVSLDKSVDDALQELEDRIKYQADVSSEYRNLFDLLSSEDVSVSEVKKCFSKLEELYKNEKPLDLDKVDTLKKALEGPALSKKNKDYIFSLLKEVNAQGGTDYNFTELDKAQLSRIKKLVNEADFQFVAYNTIGFSSMSSSEAFSQTIDDDLENFDIIIKFEKTDAVDAIIKMSEQQKMDERNPEYLQFFSSKKWRTPNGELSNQNCNECKPLVLAEGYYTPKNGKIPLVLEDLFVSSYSGHYGTWKFYDEETGSIKTYFNYAEKSNGYSLPLDPDDSDDEDFENQPKVIETHYRLSHLNIKRHNGPSFSTCLLLNRTFEDRNQFYLIELPTDSVMIKTSGINEFTPSVGMMAEFDFFRQRAVVPSLNIGASLNVLSDADNQKFNVHLGGGIHFGKSADFSLLVGLSLCRTQALRGRFQSDVWYDEGDNEYDSITDTFSYEENLFRDVFKTGYYFGIAVKL